MTRPGRDNEPDGVDRTAAEADVSGHAEVLDLDAERARRAGPAADPNADDTDHDDDPDDETGPVMVDSVAAQRRPRFTLSGFRDAQRMPIVPTWLRSSAEFSGNLAWAAGFGLHAVAYHGLRAPKYGVKLAARAPRGLRRICRGYNRWLWDLEGEPVRQSVVRAAIDHPEEAKMYDRLTNKRDRRVRWRAMLTVALVLMLVAAVGVLWVASPLVQWSAVTVLLVVLGAVGTPADRPLLDTAVVRRDAAPLNSAEVIAALAALNITGINAAIRRGDDGRRWFPSPISRENGTGWRADVELPRGVTAAAVVEKRAELAAALARPLGCVWPEVNAEVHPGRLTLFVADKDMSRAKPTPFPLVKSGKVNLFEAAPFGTDARGRLVTLTLMFASMIVGSVPRMGKTFALRLVLLIAALDPRAWVLPFDLKGTGDLSPLEPVSHRYRAGDDDEDIAYGLAAMREIHGEMRRRTKVIRELPRDLCPENKVTDELANKKKLGLHPIVIGVDECQVWFEHPKHGDEFEEICTDLIKRGPATGIDLVLATQRPDAKSLPTGISANAVLRFCLKVMGHTENDMVLGSSMHKNGVKATMFSRRDRGIGYLAGEGDDPVITRTFFVDAPGAEAIVKRARGLREKAGNITGHAAGVALDTAAVRRDNVLEDAAAVMNDKKPKLWTSVLVQRLTELRPDVYAGFTDAQLREALKVHGVKPGQVWSTDPDTGETGNRQGFTRDHILKAITESDGNGGGGKRK